MAKHLKSRLDEYGIDTATITITTDGGGNVVNVAEELGVPHIPCFAHRLNNVVMGAVDAKESAKVKLIFKKMNRIVKFFKKGEGNTKLELV